MVERLVANEKVEGSTPFARSKNKKMNDLLDKKCVPCEGGVAAMNLEEIHKYQKKVDGWNVKPNEKIFRMKKLLVILVLGLLLVCRECAENYAFRK